MKKLLLGLGSIAAAVAPIAAVVSCGSEDHNDSTAGKSTALTGAILTTVKDTLHDELGLDQSKVASVSMKRDYAYNFNGFTGTAAGAIEVSLNGNATILGDSAWTSDETLVIITGSDMANLQNGMKAYKTGAELGAMEVAITPAIKTKLEAMFDAIVQATMPQDPSGSTDGDNTNTGSGITAADLQPILDIVATDSTQPSTLTVAQFDAYFKNKAAGDAVTTVDAGLGPFTFASGPGEYSFELKSYNAAKAEATISVILSDPANASVNVKKDWTFHAEPISLSGTVDQYSSIFDTSGIHMSTKTIQELTAYKATNPTTVTAADLGIVENFTDSEVSAEYTLGAIADGKLTVNVTFKKGELPVFMNTDSITIDGYLATYFRRAVQNESSTPTASIGSMTKALADQLSGLAVGASVSENFLGATYKFVGASTDVTTAFIANDGFKDTHHGQVTAVVKTAYAVNASDATKATITLTMTLHGTTNSDGTTGAKTYTRDVQFNISNIASA